MKIPIDILFENCRKAVNKEIKKECREEALKILELCDEKDRQEFLRYSKKLDRGNLCCLVLDYAKKKLVSEDKMEQKPDDYFKDPYIWLNDESNNKEK
jgi:predicted nucleic acid-binding protein